MSDLKQVLEELEKSKQGTQQLQPAAAESQEQKEVFSSKSYWCRYFDYSNGRDPENVIMQYDRSCKLYNIFGITGPTATSATPAQASSTAPSSPEGSSTKPQVLDISDIKDKSSDLKSKELKEDKDFQKGGFYLLQLDKSKIPGVNSLFSIDLTEEGTGRLPEQSYQKKIATLRIKAPLKGNSEDAAFTFKTDSLPSSHLLVKKINNSETKKVQAEQTEAEGETENQNHSYILKRKQGDAEKDKLSVTGMWSFPPTLQEGENFKLSDLDLRFMDKVNYDELKGGSKSELVKQFSLFLDLFSAETWWGPAKTPKYASDYYLIEGVSDFWKYQVDDEVSLLRIPANSAASGNESTEEKLGDFQIVAGVIPYTSTPIWCTPNPYPYFPWFDIWYRSYKTNAIKEKNGHTYPSLCEAKEHIPSYTLIFLGDHGISKSESTK